MLPYVVKYKDSITQKKVRDPLFPLHFVTFLQTKGDILKVVLDFVPLKIKVLLHPPLYELLAGTKNF